MRVFLTVVLIAFAVVRGAPALAQPKEQKTPTSNAIYASLQTKIDTAKFAGDTLRLKEVLELLRHTLPANSPVTIVIDEEAYREENPEVPDINEIEVRMRGLPAKSSALQVLRHAIKQIPPQKSAMLVRAGRVEILPYSRTSKEWLLNQTVNVDFKDRPLDAALEELSELTGVSLVMDARTKAKAQTPVSARFRDDVALQDAVRMLTDMAELKMVYLVTGVFITTPEHAITMQKELKKLYGEEPAAGAGPAIGGLGLLGGGGGMIGGGPPDVLPPGGSLFTPPLPPRRVKTPEAAFNRLAPQRPRIAAAGLSLESLQAARLEARK